jgi:hypothetical protein
VAAHGDDPFGAECVLGGLFGTRNARVVPKELADRIKAFERTVSPDAHVTVVSHPMRRVELEAGKSRVVRINPVGDPPTLVADPTMGPTVMSLGSIRMSKFAKYALNALATRSSGVGIYVPLLA